MAVTQAVRFQFEHADVSASNLERWDHDSQLRHFLLVFLGFEATLARMATILRHRPGTVQRI
jgi:hypothetical protein